MSAAARGGAGARRAVRRYVAAWLGLLLLLAATVLLAYQPLGPANAFIAVGIAAIQVAVAALVFMRPGKETRLAWVFSLAGLFWLIFMFGLSGADYFTRPHNLIR